jgi:glycosyltransferase involved in cell wall biosynthesis
MAPRVSVIMPAYNAGKYISEAIQSVLDQSFSDFEFLILDDGSTDNTVSEIEKFSDPRIKLIRNEKNLRLVATLNKGLSLAKGEYIMRMDADDISLPDRFIEQIEYMDNNLDVGVCGTLMKTFGAEDEIVYHPESDLMIKPLILYRSLVAHPTVCFRASVIKQHQFKYSEDFIHIEDIDLWSKMMFYTKFHNIQKVLFLYRQSGENITSVNRNSRSERYYNFLTHLFAKMEIQVEERVIRFHVWMRNFPEINSVILSDYLGWINEIEELNQKKKWFDQDGLSASLKTMSNRALHTAEQFGDLSAVLYSSKVQGKSKLKSLFSYFVRKLKNGRK